MDQGGKVLRACAASAVAVGIMWAQQPAPPVRAPLTPLSAAELVSIPKTPPLAGISATKTLFDGTTLDGWRGNLDWWSVQDGAIQARSTGKVPTNFLFTKDSYSDFRLTLQSRVVESGNHAGVCFWGDITVKGENHWYTRGPLVIFPTPGMWDYIDARGLRVFRPTTEQVTSQNEWVKVEILARGNTVRTAMNGVAVMEWREADATRVKEGPIGLQLHAFDGQQTVLYKDIVVETFPKEDALLTVTGK